MSLNRLRFRQIRLQVADAAIVEIDHAVAAHFAAETAFTKVA
jgi:hypothetical protein